MAVHSISAQEALSQWPLEDAITSAGQQGPRVIDARSPSEFALDHLPHAHNWPVLNDEQRAKVGTLYKQVNPFEANKLGAAWVSENIARHLHHHVQGLQRDWKPFVYCWRGGKRSGSLAFVLGQIGFSVRLIEGGYKAFRQQMLLDLQRLSRALQWVVIDGPTGSGKTHLLHHLQQQGAQILDLEELALHRSSVLGHRPGVAQPSQKHFDMKLWDALRRLDPARPVFVEAESKRVGAVTIHPDVFASMQSAALVNLQAPLADRVQRLCSDYAHFLDNPSSFQERILALQPIVGKQVIQHWHDLSTRGQWSTLVEDLLLRHYDPNYLRASRRLFGQAEATQPPARTVVLDGLDDARLAQCALELMQATGLAAGRPTNLVDSQAL
jgi:tRNA 2-selenouridine synthase